MLSQKATQMPAVCVDLRGGRALSRRFPGRAGPLAEKRCDPRKADS
jgi:hypothetical protein